MSLAVLSPEYLESLNRAERASLKTIFYEWGRKRAIASEQKTLEQRTSPLRERYGSLMYQTDDLTDFSLQSEMDNAYDGGFAYRGDEDNPWAYLLEEKQQQPIEMVEDVRPSALRRQAGDGVIYIGAMDHQERKQLFMATFGDQESLVRFAYDNGADYMNGLPDISEDPYRPGLTWYTSAQLNAVDLVGLDEKARHHRRMRYFNMRYNVTGPLDVNESVTRPKLHTAEWATPHALFKDVLFERDELVLKMTPLKQRWVKHQDGRTMYKSDEELEQIYNEVRIAFFLQELVFNYSHILSPHFMSIVDWFVMPHEDPSGDIKMSKLYQVTIVERMDRTLRAHLKRGVTLAEFRCILFQIFNALEVAWITHRFVHYDMHDENIMMKHTTGALDDRNFVYKRYNDQTYWYVLDQNVMGGYYVKIIDLGRSRIDAPTSQFDGYIEGEQHDHSQLVGPYEFEEQGYGKRLRANPYYDVRLFFAFLFYMPDRFWHGLEQSAGGPEEIGQLYDLFDRALDVDRLYNTYNRDQMVNDPSGLASDEYGRMARTLPQNKMTSRDLRKSSQMPYWMLLEQNYVRSTEPFGLTPSGMLDHAFFAPLRRRFMVNDAGDAQLALDKIDQQNVVVSFPTNFQELNPRIQVSERAQDGDDQVSPHVSQLGAIKTPSCIKCHHNCATPAQYGTVGENGETLYFCGPVCYEFKYVFGQRAASFHDLYGK